MTVSPARETNLPKVKLLVVNDARQYLADRRKATTTPCGIDPALRSVFEQILGAADVETLERIVASDKTDDDFARMKRFDAGIRLDTPDEKKATTIKDADGNVVDYRDVRIAGYLSTFEGTTKSDRQGDYVVQGAFAETIKKFMVNPVMLRDHYNDTDYLAGEFTKVKEDTRGLYVEGRLSNAPGLRDLRFKVAEGVLRTLSMGGMFHYLEDGRGIFKVELWEGSLTPIPANQDATFETRSLNDCEKAFVKSGQKVPYVIFRDRQARMPK